MRRSGNSARATATSASATSGTSRPSSRFSCTRENTVIPSQVVVYSPKGTNHKIELLFGTSLYDLKAARDAGGRGLSVRDGMRLFSPAAALVRVPESFLRRQPIETQVVLASLATPRTCCGFFSTAAIRRRRASSPERSAASAGRAGRRDRQDDEGRGIRRARERSVRGRRRHSAHCRRRRRRSSAACRRCGNRCAAPSSRRFPTAPGLPKDKDALSADSSTTSTRAMRTTRCRSKATASRPR